MAEKNLKPTRKKLKDAREKGQVPHSPVLVRFVASIAVLELILGTRGYWLPSIMAMAERPFHVMGAAATIDDRLLGTIVMPVLSIAGVMMVTVAAIAAVLGVGANVMQTGVVIATKALPKWDAFNAIGTLTQMFTADKFMELALNLAKVVIIGGCSFYAIYSSLETILHMGDYSLIQSLDRFLDVAVYTERSSMAAIIVLVTADWALKRHAFMKQMRMSIEDVKREYKESEGDPHTKASRKRMGREIMMGQGTMQKVAKADAVVTNPTHFAVALSFKPTVVPIPIVLARGEGHVALRMIEVAKEAGVPRIRYVWLARTLYSVGREGRPIPRVTLRAVAAVYLALQSLAERGQSADEPIDLGSDPEDPTPCPPESEDSVKNERRGTPVASRETAPELDDDSRPPSSQESAPKPD